MPKFAVDIPHQLAPDDVRTRLDRATTKLEKDYGAHCQWQGEQLVVSRKGLNARVAIEPTRLHVDVDLGFLLAPMAGTIRNGITKQLTELLSTPPSPPPQQ
jgi:putative polyhydroxyalkanoate system protein